MMAPLIGHLMASLNGHSLVPLKEEYVAHLRPIFTGAGVHMVGRVKRNWVVQLNAIGWCTYLQLGGAFELQLHGAFKRN